MDVLTCILLAIITCGCGYLTGNHLGYKKGFEKAKDLPDSDGLSKDEKEQLRQVINVLSWNGGSNED